MQIQDQNADARDVPWVIMMGILGVRLVMISAFLILLSLILKTDNIAFYAFIAFAYIITIPYSLWMRNQQRMRQLAPLQFLVDLVFVSGLVYFAGGIANDFLILLYPLIILSAGIILPLKQTVQITILAIISYLLIVLLVQRNVLIQPATALALDPAAELIHTPAAMTMRIVLFLFFGVASAYVSRRCDYITVKERQSREITRIIFENVKTGLLLLDGDDRILVANARACALLGRSPESLDNMPIRQIHIKASELNKEDPSPRGAADYFLRADGSAFPVAIEDATLTLPASALSPASENPDRPTQVRIINFNDLTTFLRLQERNRCLERIEAAAEMAAEMAHHVRTPLTSVSISGELLAKSVIEKPGPEGDAERIELCNQVIDQCVRMNQVIQNFLNYAEFSPEEARNLIRLDIDNQRMRGS